MPVVDWRDRFGRNHITRIRDQAPSENCWAFAVTALVEAMTRIEHYVWANLSEADLARSAGKQHRHIGNIGEALIAAERYGIADQDCLPWNGGDVIYSARPHGPDMRALPMTTTPDRAGRTVRTAGATVTSIASGLTNEKRAWLSATGPMAVSVIVPGGFGAAPADGIFVAVPGGGGAHVMLVVGFDDDNQCWIVKNSWGVGFASGGFVRVAYGQAWLENTDWVGLRGTNPGPLTKRRQRNGIVLESGNGAARQNRELFLRNQTNRKMTHYWQEAGAGPWIRHGDVKADDPWHPLVDDSADHPAVVQSTFNRNYDLVFRTTNGRLRHIYFDQAFGWWFDMSEFGPNDCVDLPGFVQGNRGAPGDYEVVVRTAGGQLHHWAKQNSSPWRRRPGEWHERGIVANGVSCLGPALVIRRTGVAGELEMDAGELHLVAGVGTKLRHYSCPTGSGTWTQLAEFGAGPYQSVCMIESVNDRGNELSVGHLELFAVYANAIVNWRLTTPAAGQPVVPWSIAANFGADVRRVLGALQGSRGHLEVYCEDRFGRCVRYTRMSGVWDGGIQVA